MRRVIITAIVLSMMALYGCIISSSPAGLFPITIDTGDTIEFKVTTFPPNSDATWTLQLDGNDFDTSTGMSYTFTPEEAGDYNMTVDVVDPWGSTQNRIWVIIVK